MTPPQRLIGKHETLNEDYPTAWNKEEFENMRSFNGKLKYAAKTLQKIATGSGRAVFKIDEQKVLKIAKNKKGLAQNAVESEPFLQQYSITAKVFDSSNHYTNNTGPFWLEMELAKKVSKGRFKQLVGVGIDEMYQWIIFRVQTRKFPAAPPRTKADEKYAYEMDNNEFIIDIMSLIGDYDMQPGDMGRTSTYGEVIRDGKPTIVMVDFGLTRQVFQDWYRVR
jgi:hypothetical protein